MDDAKKIIGNKVSPYLIILYLLLFPFGQLFKVSVFNIPILVIDLLVTQFLVLQFWFKKPREMIYFVNIFSVFFFSLLISLAYYPFSNVAVGFLYLIRLVSYFSMIVAVWNLVKNNILQKDFLYDMLIITTLTVAIIGWIQYFKFADLVVLKYIGWDDHLNRLVSSFLDPAFTGLILVFGVILTFNKYLKSKKLYLLYLSLFVMLTLAFTYSRASYLALIAGLLYFVFKNINKKLIFLILSGLIILIPILPRSKSEGVRLERTFSAFSKIRNYRETLTIIVKNPLFGVGFNNICYERIKLFHDQRRSHSCFGSDSSMLFILATTGVIGFTVFLYSLSMIYKSIKLSFYSRALFACCISVFVHSLFTNSLFYSFVLGFLSILTAVSLGSKAKG